MDDDFWNSKVIISDVLPARGTGIGTFEPRSNAFDVE